MDPMAQKTQGKTWKSKTGFIQMTRIQYIRLLPTEQFHTFRYHENDDVEKATHTQ